MKFHMHVIRLKGLFGHLPMSQLWPFRVSWSLFLLSFWHLFWLMQRDRTCIFVLLKLDIFLLNIGTLDQVWKASFATATAWLNYSWDVCGAVPKDYCVTGFLTGYFPWHLVFTNYPLTKFLNTWEKAYRWYLARSNMFLLINLVTLK